MASIEIRSKIVGQGMPTTSHDEDPQSITILFTCVGRVDGDVLVYVSGSVVATNVDHWRAGNVYRRWSRSEKLLEDSQFYANEWSEGEVEAKSGQVPGTPPHGCKLHNCF